MKKKQKICKNGKTWGSHNSYEDPIYKKLMSDIKFKNAKSLNKDGYVIIHAFIDSTFKRKTYLEHRYIMEKFLGRKLKREEQIHHINYKRADNRIENLMLCANQKEHFQYHGGTRYTQRLKKTDKTNSISVANKTNSGGVCEENRR